MAPKPDKVIVTNIAALERKYRQAGLDKIKRSIDALIAADGERGLTTKLIALDDRNAMRALSAPPVTRAGNTGQNKRAIDGVYRALAPDYIVILGSSDVVPHQDLTNPMYGPGEDEDEDRRAFGDLPYACEGPYSRKIRNFLGPTRVVGRIPDINGGHDPDYLCRLLKVAAEYKTTTLAELRKYFAVTASVWHDSTTLSVATTFGPPARVKDVPRNDSKWPARELASRMHFINCHGATRSSQFFGQPRSGAEQYPPALDAAQIDGKIREGTIVAAECCYGGELYRPSATEPQIGICNTYFANKAYGYVGSTTISYGEDEINGQADLICQFFLQNVMRGASLGRAMLDARQHFVRKSSPMDPTDLKTLAQFNLYGDPSLTPMATATPFVSAGPTALAAAARSDRGDRRRLLFREGMDLAEREPVPERVSKKPKKAVLSGLQACARAEQTKPGAVMSFSVKERAAARLPKAMRLQARQPLMFHVMFAKSKKKPSAKRKKLGIVDIIAFIGKEVGGQLVSVKKVRSR